MARRARARLPDRCEGREPRRAGRDEAHRRPPVLRPADHRDRPRRAVGRHRARGRRGVAGRRVCARAAVDVALYRAARDPVLEGHRECGAPTRAAGVPAPARAVAALPSGAADGRHVARHRARHARHPAADFVFAVQHPADARRGRARARLLRGQVRGLLRIRDVRRAGHVHRVHGEGHQLAHAFPPHDERTRFARELAGDRFADQLRDGQVLRQRGVGSAALRREPEALPESRDPFAELAVGAELRPAGDHRHGARVHPVARDAGRARGQADARRSGADQHVHAAAVHPAELSRCRLSRAEAEPHRYGSHVRAAVGREGSGRPARCAAACGRRRAGALRAREFRVRAGAADPARRVFHDRRGHDDRGGRPQRFREVDAVAAAVPLLRSRPAGGRGDPDRRPGHPRRHAGLAARVDRDRAAGHRAVQRLDLLQHRVRPADRDPRRGDRGRARRAHPRFHRKFAEGL